MKVLKDKVAAVTGAASGIGRALAAAFAGEGCHVAISDVNEAGLKETAALVGSRGVRCSIHVVDAADRGQVARYAADAVKIHGAVHILVNNAGVTLFDTLESVDYADLEWLLAINLWGVIYGCKEFLPYLKRQDEAHIVNISSINGIFTNPNNGPYCTAKFAVRGFTETLCQEMKGTSVRVSCVHPGGIRTNIVRNARFHRAADKSLDKEELEVLFDRFIAHLSADEAARVILAGIRKNKPRIMVGRDAYLCDWLKRLFPVGFQKLMAGKKVPLRMKAKIGPGK
jgi:NAD(P)-dependent dehydrogenase (short-subunit alcohol dehydrogenase family)